MPETEAAMTKKLQAYALMSQRWVTPLDSLKAIDLLALSQTVGRIEADSALMRGRQMLRKWHKTQTGARVMAYRIVRV